MIVRELEDEGEVNFEDHFEDFELFWFSNPLKQLKENGIILIL